MKTLFLFLEFPEEIFFFELEGDYSKFDGVFIGSAEDDETLQEQLCALVYNEETGDFLQKKLGAPTKDWDVFVRCGALM